MFSHVHVKRQYWLMAALLVHDAVPVVRLSALEALRDAQQDRRPQGRLRGREETLCVMLTVAPRLMSQSQDAQEHISVSRYSVKHVEYVQTCGMV